MWPSWLLSGHLSPSLTSALPNRGGRRLLCHQAKPPPSQPPEAPCLSGVLRPRPLG